MSEELLITPAYIEPIRARRRREKDNAFRKAVKYIKQANQWYPLPEDVLLEQAHRRADNFQICSCHMCGNQRRNFLESVNDRLTHQERKAWLDMKQQYEELNLRLPKKRAGRTNER